MRWTKYLLVCFYEYGMHIFISFFVWFALINKGNSAKIFCRVLYYIV
jgi:hypothetical protein